MSAVNVLVQRDSVHLLTDAVSSNLDGVVLSIGPKVTPMPHLNCAVGFRGPHSARPILGELIGLSAQSFDELRDVIVETLQMAAKVYAQLFEQCHGGPDFEVIVAGVSEKDGPFAYLVASHHRYGAAWTLTPIYGLTCLPNNDEIMSKIAAVLPTSCDPNEIDPAVHGAAVMEIQRKHIVDNQGVDGEFCAIGGFIQLTTATATDVTSRVILRWSDRMGQRIEVAA